MSSIDHHLATLEKLEVIPEKEVKSICEKVLPPSPRPNKS